MILYDPSEMLKKISPASKIKKLLSKRLSVKRAALSFVDNIDFIDKAKVATVALKAVRNYKERLSDLEGKEKTLERKDITKNPKLLIQRVQNAVVTQIKDEIKEKYAGEKYEWLPSDADEPDPEHQLKYGQIFTIGQGEMPGDRFGCRCAMRILTKDDELKL